MDKNLVAALTKAYTARAQLFHTGVKASRIDLLIAEIDDIDGSRLNWASVEIGVSLRALELLRRSGGTPHQVFAHPDIIKTRPHLICYYRNIVTISKKGIDQILFSTDAYESGRKEGITDADARKICQTFNRILSAVIEELPNYSVSLSRQACLAEIGTELQGSWANAIGQGAARAVRGVLCEYIREKDFGTGQCQVGPAAVIRPTAILASWRRLRFRR